MSDHERIVLLNTMISRSSTRAKGFDAPVHSARELLEILEHRRKRGVAVEFFGSADDDDDVKRIEKGKASSRIRLRESSFEDRGDFTYATLLVELIDIGVEQFAVVHLDNYTGRSLRGQKRERGAFTCHVVVRLPAKGAYDDGVYRCAIEVVSPITRGEIETLLSRQIRRGAAGWTFPATITPKGGKPKEKHYQYTPHLELAADVGRSLESLSGRELSSMVFTKRHEKKTTGKPTAVDHEEFLADVRYQVSTSQGPTDPAERRSWAEKIKRYFELSGFDTKLYFRHANGAVTSGGVHKAVASAADLLMCPRDHISFDTPLEPWTDAIDPTVTASIQGLLDKDELWERRSK